MGELALKTRPDGSCQFAVGKLTFDEMTAPSDGAIRSDNPDLVTAVLADDMMTWTCTYLNPSVSGVANISYTGTSMPPKAGPAVVPPMVVTCTAAPAAERGDFNPGNAVIS